MIYITRPVYNMNFIQEESSLEAWEKSWRFDGEHRSFWQFDFEEESNLQQQPRQVCFYVFHIKVHILEL